MATGGGYIYIGPNAGGGGGAPTYPLAAPSGSATAPSYNFSAAPTTGMYYDATNSGIGFSTGGTERWYIDGNGNWVNPNGNGFTGNYILMGPATSVGVIIARNGSGNVQFALGDASANATLSAAAFKCANAGTAFTSGFSPTTGIYLNASDVMGTASAGVSSSQINAAGQWSTLKWLVQPKTGTTYTTVVADSQTTITNTGNAGALAVTLITTPTLGTIYTFTKPVAQTFTVAPGGSDKIQGITGTTFTLITLSSQYSSVTVQYVAANVWQVVSVVGTVTSN